MNDDVRSDPARQSRPPWSDHRGLHARRAAQLREAEALARRLAGSPIQALYSSPLERARATAAAIAERLGLEVRIADELNEIDYGQWSNRALADLRDVPEWRRFNLLRSSGTILQPRTEKLAVFGGRGGQHQMTLHPVFDA